MMSKIMSHEYFITFLKNNKTQQCKYEFETYIGLKKELSQ